MPLVELLQGVSQWRDIEDAAHTLWQATLSPNLSAIAIAMRNHYQNPHLSILELNTGLSRSRRAVVVCNGEKITIAFLGSDSNELHMKMWFFAKGLGLFDIPYPVYENGNQVHSFFRDMWHGMRQATYSAISRAVEEIAARRATPKQIIVTGYSMGGGISM